MSEEKRNQIIKQKEEEFNQQMQEYKAYEKTTKILNAFFKLNKINKSNLIRENIYLFMSLGLSLLDLVALLYCYAASKTTSASNLIYRFTSLICLLTII